MKRIKPFILALALLLLVATGTAYAMDMSNADYSVDVFVYGKQVNFPDQKAFVDTSVNRTYVPVRFVSEALGASVDWKADAKTVTITNQGLKVVLTIDSDQATVTNQTSKTVTLDAPAVLVNDRTMVPLRFVSEVLGAKVGWTPAAQGGNSKVDLTPSVSGSVYGL